MGLDTSHNAWHGAYSSFMEWRREIAKAAGLPPLDLMEGFYEDGKDEHGNIFNLLDYAYPNEDALEMMRIRRVRKQLPIKWKCLKQDPLHELLSHSDCDGEIEWQNCQAIANSLDLLMPLLTEEDHALGPYSIKTRTNQFINGLLLAYEKQENLIFH